MKMVPEGLQIRDISSNGTYLNGKCYHNETFVWSWEEELILGGASPDDNYHPLTVTLKKAEKPKGAR